eukprot:GHVN01085731.1.p1 GENE.GHVN01085731.1~~GHVN01085731.1.p1  ORF type:complete len:213 (+),score=57.84 GHVN01085731.1:84-722(+)
MCPATPPASLEGEPPAEAKLKSVTPPTSTTSPSSTPPPKSGSPSPHSLKSGSSPSPRPLGSKRGSAASPLPAEPSPALKIDPKQFGEWGMRTPRPELSHFPLLYIPQSVNADLLQFELSAGKVHPECSDFVDAIKRLRAEVCGVAGERQVEVVVGITCHWVTDAVPAEVMITSGPRHRLNLQDGMGQQPQLDEVFKNQFRGDSEVVSRQRDT